MILLIDGRPVRGLLLPCIDCREPLPTEPNVDGGKDVVECPCGLRYNLSLIQQMHAEVWAYITLNRFFCLKCDYPSAPIIHTGDRGQVVPCPTHGPAPPR